MPRDHYVAQTYLKHFADGTGMLHAYRKDGGEPFPCRPRDVCAEWNGDLNPNFLPQNPALLADFRAMFEPHWNIALQRLIEQRPSHFDRLAIAALFGLFMTAVPAWRRAGAAVWGGQAGQYLRFAQKMKEKHALQMLDRGEIKLEVDDDFIRALITKRAFDAAWTVYNQDWEVCSNATGLRLATSDSPIALLTGRKLGAPVARILPLSPATVLSSIMHRRVEDVRPEEIGAHISKPSAGRLSYKGLTMTGAKEINRLTAQCAENMVFSSAPSAGIAELVRKYRNWRVDAEQITLPAREPDAEYHGSVLTVREKGRQSV